MAKITKDRLLARLDIALKNLYHNATPHYPSVVEDLCRDFDNAFSSWAENEIYHLRDGGACGKTAYTDMKHIKDKYKAAENGLLWEAAFRYYANKWREDQAESREGNIIQYGKLYQWGRGGRTLAPDNLVKTGGGSSFWVKRGEDFAECSNAYLTTMILDIDAFNTYVEHWNEKSNLQYQWQEECGYRFSEKQEEAKACRISAMELAHQARALDNAGDSVCSLLVQRLRADREDHRRLCKEAGLWKQGIAV